MVGVQAWKIEWSQIVRSLNFHTPEIDFSCHRAAQIQGQKKEVTGVSVFRVQVGWKGVGWQCLETGGTPGKQGDESRNHDERDTCHVDMAAWEGTQKQDLNKLFCLVF